MTDRSSSPPPLPQGPNLTQEQLDAIAGGECSVSDYQRAIEELKNTYEQLVDFTSYVIERVAGGTGQ